MVGSLGRPLRQVCFPLNKVVLTLYGISVLISLGLAAAEDAGIHFKSSSFGNNNVDNFNKINRR